MEERDYIGMQAGAALEQHYGRQTAANVGRDQRPLESLALAAQRVNSAVVRVQNFIDRWHGSKPEAIPTGGMNAGNAIQPPHRESLERLFAAIDRLEDRLESLDQIG